jgi:hypothetical protein
MSLLQPGVGLFRSSIPVLLQRRTSLAFAGISRATPGSSE